ncbi:MAG: transposase [Acidobacteria bacterium]|nr:transposase [Acidobacteriota bacterium]MBI3657809.1 transposase [Acidobacteriota bacterium]
MSQSKNVALRPLVGELKKASSAWQKTNGREFARFHWQDEYGGFSIGKSQVPVLMSYFARQKQHHRKKTFQEGLMELLEKYEIVYDARYLWD